VKLNVLIFTVQQRIAHRPLLRSVVDSGFAREVMSVVCWFAKTAAAGEADR